MCTFLQPSVLDFGKIIIYTSNLRIIRAPLKKPEMRRQLSVLPLELEECPKVRDGESRRRPKALQAQEDMEKNEKGISNRDTKVMTKRQIILSCFLSPHFSGLFFHSHLSLYPLSPQFSLSPRSSIILL